MSLVRSIQLPKKGGELYTYKPQQAVPFEIPEGKPFEKRIAFSAAHVVADPFADTDPLNESQIDWDLTMKYRHYLWSQGLAVAEAMDTARSEEHTSELQSRGHLVCRLLLEKTKNTLY